MRASKTVHIDSDYLAQGTHKGANGVLIIYDKGKDFKSCGITVGVAIYNDTDGSNGLVTVVTEDTVTCTLSGGTNNTWTKGDTYSIYKTATKNSYISSLSTDRRFGRKVVKGDDLNTRGFFEDDVDTDQDRDNVWGEGQPEERHDY